MFKRLCKATADLDDKDSFSVQFVEWSHALSKSHVTMVGIQAGEFPAGIEILNNQDS